MYVRRVFIVLQINSVVGIGLLWAKYYRESVNFCINCSKMKKGSVYGPS